MSRGLEFRSFSGYLKDKLNGSLIATLKYDRLVSSYRAAFGEDRVLVLLYEHLARDPESFLRRMCEFVGVEPPRVDTSSRPNMTSRSAWTLNINRILNLPGRLAVTAILHSPGGGRSRAGEVGKVYGRVKERMFESLASKPRRSKRTRLVVHPSVKAQIDAEIGPSNRRLAVILGEPLSELGYHLE